MTKVDDVLEQLKSRGDPGVLGEMARYGINTERAFGTSMGAVKELVKAHKGDHQLALDLWDTGWREARLLAGQIADPKRVTPGLMDTWVTHFDSWDVCDSTCGQLFRRTPHAYDKALEWSRSGDEFTRRAGFVLMAGLGLKSAKMRDEEYEVFFERIRACATDERNMVKKAVNWALRQIGKRNAALNTRAIAVAEEILASGDPTARWIATDALRELRGEKVQARMKGR